MNSRDVLGSIVGTVVILVAIAAPASARAPGEVPSGVAPAGGHTGWNDYDGNGVADLAIGAPGDEVAGHPGAGSVTILYGDPNGLHASGSQYWTQASQGIEGAPENGDSFGWALASGDFDGDGFGDLAIGIPDENLSGANDPLGAVEVLYGSPSGLKGTGSRLIRSPDRGQFGYALAALDNVNGVADGKADLAVGEPLLPGFRVYSGPGIKRSDPSAWGKSYALFSYAGSALVAGDFVSGGADDLAVGMPDAGANEEGRVDVLTGLSVIHYSTETMPSNPLAPHGAFGYANAGAIVVVYDDAGTGTLISQATVGVEGAPEQDDRFGWSLASANWGRGGRSDLAVGVLFESIGGNDRAGAVHVIYGSGTGLSTGTSSLFHQDSLLVPGTTGHDHKFGASVY